MWFLFRTWLSVMRLLPRERRDLVLENLALRHQQAVYQRSQRRPDLVALDRRFWSTLARGWSEWRGTISIVQPDTVVRWHRTAWRRYWTWKSRRHRPGRPRIAPEIRELIMRMARENRTWGAVRLVGELRALGIEVSASTVRAYRRQALRRPPLPSWRTFLRLQCRHIWAADFFTVQTLTFRTLYSGCAAVFAHARPPSAVGEARRSPGSDRCARGGAVAFGSANDRGSSPSVHSRGGWNIGRDDESATASRRLVTGK